MKVFPVAQLRLCALIFLVPSLLEYPSGPYIYGQNCHICMRVSCCSCVTRSNIFRLLNTQVVLLLTDRMVRFLLGVSCCICVTRSKFVPPSLVRPSGGFVVSRGRPITLVGLNIALQQGDADFARKVAKVQPEVYIDFKRAYLANRCGLGNMRRCPSNLYYGLMFFVVVVLTVQW